MHAGILGLERRKSRPGYVLPFCLLCDYELHNRYSFLRYSIRYFFVILREGFKEFAHNVYGCCDSNKSDNNEIDDYYFRKKKYKRKTMELTRK